MTYNDLFEAKLKDLCEQQIAHEAEVIVTGAAVQNIADYKHRTGIIAGLRKAIELCDEANRLIAER